MEQYKLAQYFRAVAVFASRSCDPGVPHQYQLFERSEVAESIPLLTRVYLDELSPLANLSLVLGMVRLVVEDEDTAVSEVWQLIQQAQRSLADEAFKEKVVGLIETIVVYKLQELTRRYLWDLK